jgi:periplasmic protein TonB
MKLDLFKKQWLDIVFEGRNKSYGAYDLRKTNSNTTFRALLIGAVFFAMAVATPLLASFLHGANNDDDNLDTKIRTIKLPPKAKVDPLAPPPPPPPPPKPKVDVVKFTKPVVAKAEEVVEDPPKVQDMKDKDIGDKNQKGDPNAEEKIDQDFGKSDEKPKVVEDTNEILNLAGVEVKPEFPGGIEKFYGYVGKTYQTPEDAPSGKVFVSFVVEKDGSLTDIKVLRDVGFGSGTEAVRILKRCPKWLPGEQNGKKVRVLYSLPITIQAPE